MSVYFRTGRNSGVGVSWWFYFFVVAPIQLVALMVKGFVYMGVALVALTVMVSRFARDRWERRRND